MPKEIKITLPVTSPHSPLLALDRDLTEVGIDYALVGGVALGIYNYLRYTEDIDILISRRSTESLKKLEGKGYIYSETGKLLYLLLTDTRIRIDIVIEGDDFGLVMPDPTTVRQRVAGLWVVNLPTLVTLKILAGRNKDLQDVLQLIQENDLDTEFSNELPEPAATKFRKLLEIDLERLLDQ